MNLSEEQLQAIVAAAYSKGCSDTEAGLQGEASEEARAFLASDEARALLASDLQSNVAGR